MTSIIFVFLEIRIPYINCSAKQSTEGSLYGAICYTRNHFR
jgi:hypothetical protein